jgi:transcriptional regulator with XRE-family HTH domain
MWYDSDMSRRTRPLQPGPRLWGPQRARLGISLRELEARTGIGRGDLSRMENRGLEPTSDEFDRIMAALYGAPVVQASTEPATT